MDEIFDEYNETTTGQADVDDILAECLGDEYQTITTDVVQSDSKQQAPVFPSVIWSCMNRVMETASTGEDISVNEFNIMLRSVFNSTVASNPHNTAAIEMIKPIMNVLQEEEDVSSSDNFRSAIQEVSSNWSGYAEAKIFGTQLNVVGTLLEASIDKRREFISDKFPEFDDSQIHACLSFFSYLVSNGLAANGNIVVDAHDVDM